MSFRFGLVVGFAVGYYLGAKAGRERYEQLHRMVREVPLDEVAEKGRAAVELAVERVRSAAESSDPLGAGS